MSRYQYNGNGQKLNREIDLDVLWDETTEEAKDTSRSLPLANKMVTGNADRLERFYLTLAGAVMGRMKAEELRMRTLASGLMVYTTERRARLEPGIEATLMSDDTVAYNFENLFQPPEEIPTLGHDHTLWVAQQLIDYDYGVQSQRRKLESRNY